jgi:DNA-binding beta-propeller fold protein YncE
MQGDDPTTTTAHARQLLDSCSRTITVTRIQAGDDANAFRAETSAFPELHAGGAAAAAVALPAASDEFSTALIAYREWLIENGMETPENFNVDDMAKPCGVCGNDLFGDEVGEALAVGQCVTLRQLMCTQLQPGTGARQHVPLATPFPHVYHGPCIEKWFDIGCMQQQRPACCPDCKFVFSKKAHTHEGAVESSMSSGEGDGRQLQRRLDVRAETSAFAARPAFIWAFQISQKQLEAVVTQRPSLLHPTAAQVRAFGLQFGAKQRQSLLTCSRLSATLAARLLCFGGECAVKCPLRKAVCILSRRHKLPGRLGAVAAAGAGCVRVIGSRGDGNGQFECPYGGVAFDGEGNLVVCDGDNHRIQVFRCSDGTHLRSFGSRGAGNGQFYCPWGIAFDGAGHIVVSEDGGSRVQVLRYSDGAHVRTIGSRGSCNGQFSYPTAIAVDGEGNVAVFDGGNARVQVYRLSDGAHIRTIGSRGSGNGQFFGGNGGVAFDSEGNLVVADCDNHRVQVLRYSDGTHVRTIEGSEGTGAGQIRHPMGVAFDAAGHIVVLERGRVQVLRYSDGAHVRTIGSYGYGYGQFFRPFGGIAIDSDGRIVVADTWNHRVQVLE